MMDREILSYNVQKTDFVNNNNVREYMFAEGFGMPVR